MEHLDAVFRFLGTQYSLGSSLSFTPGSILLGLGLIVLLVVISSFVRKVLRVRIFPRAGLSTGVGAAMSTLAYYFVMVVGLLLIMPVTVSGFNVQTLSVMLGAVSFGIGFGMRNIADNFISGIILLIERPIKVGDRIEVGGIYGTVLEIRGRATIVRTNDEVDIIIPNSEFISGRVTNASYGTPRVRFRIPVGVHYKSDVAVVSKALVEAGMETEGVLHEPPPMARFMEFGDSSLNFELWIWTEELFSRPAVLKSSANFAIWEKLKKYGVEVPYPQRDVYIKESPSASVNPAAPLIGPIKP